MSGVLRLGNTGAATGRSTIQATATSDATFSLPSAGGTILTTDFDTIGTITWNGSNINITNADLNVDNGTLFVDESTNRVGIGTTSPGKLLALQDSSTPALGFYTGATLRAEINATSSETSILSYANSPITFNIGGSAETEAVRIDASGRLLVGTSTASTTSMGYIQEGSAGIPSSAANILLAKKTTSVSNGASLGTIYFSDSSQDLAAYVDCARDGGTWTSGSSQPTRLVLATTADGVSSPTERMRIDSKGNVGIGGSPTIFTGQNFISVHSPGSSTNISGLDFYVSNTRQSGFLSYPSIGESLRIFSNTANSITIHNNGSERMRILPTGGLTFNGDTAQANALDDYEEGGWTGTIQTSTTGGQQPLLAESYVKIGRFVIARAYYTFPTGFSVADTAIRGLPFTSTALGSAAGATLEWQDGGSFGAGIGRVDANNTQAVRWGFTSGPSGSFAGNLWITVTYESAN